MKNKKGSFPGGHSVTGGLKMGVNVAAHTRHIFLGSPTPTPPPPGISDHMPGHMTVHVGRSTVFTNWAGYAHYATTTRRVQHIQRAPDLEMYRVSRLLRRGRVGSKVRTKNMINTALEIERL